MVDGADIDDILRGYVTPSRKDVERWWEIAMFAVDTNVLLNLYRYSTEERAGLLTVLRTLGDRLWIPHRVADEFARNRPGVLSQQRSRHEQVRAKFDQLDSMLSPRTGASPAARRKLEKLRDEVVAAERNRLGDDGDPLLDDIVKLLRGRVGKGLTATRHEEVVTTEGPERYGRNAPPGCGDADKATADNAFGDLLIWNELLEFAVTVRRPIVFVTDDQKSRKSDWFWSEQHGAHPLLIRELWDRAGVPLLIYETARFIKRANSSLGLEAHIPDKVSDDRGMWAPNPNARTGIAFASPARAFRRAAGVPAPIVNVTRTSGGAELLLENVDIGQQLIEVSHEEGLNAMTFKAEERLPARLVRYPDEFADATSLPRGTYCIVTWSRLVDGVPLTLDHASFVV